MRSLTSKLTLAFLLVGLTGAILVAVLVGQRTRSEFNRFLSEQDQNALVDTLASYYVINNGWDGVGAFLRSSPPLEFYSRGAAVIDAAGVVVAGNRTLPTGQSVPSRLLADAIPVQVNDKPVGYVVTGGPGDRVDGPPARDRRSGAGRPPDPDIQFLENVAWASGVSAGTAALLALLLGGLLARTLTRPLRELTEATRIMASGRFDQRVAVRSRDEIGALAASFNQMSADLERASQLRKQMTADLAHDLRTPLSILRGYTEGLQDGRLQGSPALYTIMHGEVEHLQRLVEDLRTLSLADAGELPLNRRAVDPQALLERTGLAYFVQAEQQGLTLRVEAAANLPSIEVDTDRMTQVLNNLVSNALRHTQQGEITLAASTHGQAVHLTVKDTGSGIAAEDLPFIFDRFYRVDKARSRSDDPSSGLGLAIAKAIVEAHGGTISVASAPGQGTTFTVALPVAAGLGHERRRASDTRKPDPTHSTVSHATRR